MKMLKTTKIAIIGMLSLYILALVPNAEARPGDRVSFQLFYDQLAPYGEWVDDPEYGYIWLPDAGPNFMPYSSNGYWVMTKYGNTWVSNYEWGWAPFHYGRWYHTDYYGWAWVPDYEWGPAWVTWRSGGGYYGWAPLGPRMSIAVTVRIPSFHWVFVPDRYITSPYMHRYYVSRRNHVRIYNHTTIINNVYVLNNKKYVSGPARRDIERSTGSRVSVRTINNSNQPNRVAVNSRSVSLYRPTIDESSRSQARPARVTDAQTARTRVAERVADNREASGASGAGQQPRAATGRSATPAPATRSRVEGREAVRRTAEGREVTGASGAGQQPRAATGRSATPAPATRSRTEARAATGRTATPAPATRSRVEGREAVRRTAEGREVTGSGQQPRAATGRSATPAPATRSRTEAREATNRSSGTQAVSSSRSSSSVSAGSNNSAAARNSSETTRSSGGRN